MLDLTLFLKDYGISTHGVIRKPDYETIARHIYLSYESITPERFVSSFVSLSIPPTSRMKISDVTLFSEQFNIQTELSRLHPFVLRNINLKFFVSGENVRLTFSSFSISDLLSPAETQEALSSFSPTFSFQYLFEPNKKELIRKNTVELDNYIFDFLSELRGIPTDELRDVLIWYFIPQNKITNKKNL